MSKIDELHERANKLVSEHQLEGAIEVFSEILKLDPDNSLAFRRRGFCYHFSNSTLAIRDYSSCLQIDPNDAKALSNRGDLFLLAGRPADSLDDFKRAYEITSSPSALLGVANALFNLDRKQESLEEVSSVIERTSDDPVLHAKGLLFRGMIHVNQEGYEQAARDLTKAIEIGERLRKTETFKEEGLKILRSCRKWRALAYETMGRFDEALGDISEAIQIIPPEGRALRAYYISVLEKKGDWETANTIRRLESML